MFKDEDAEGGASAMKVNPFKMTKKQNDIAKLVGQKIKCSVDKKTSVITINVEDQDPLICATIADSARVKLQQFIIKYRTNKARIDLEYTKICIKKLKDSMNVQDRYMRCSLMPIKTWYLKVTRQNWKTLKTRCSCSTTTISK